MQTGREFGFLISDDSLRLQIVWRWKLLLLEFFQTRARSIHSSCRAQMQAGMQGSTGRYANRGSFFWMDGLCLLEKLVRPQNSSNRNITGSGFRHSLGQMAM